ncbi:hypothetical protein CJF32_00000892 [Rutstroemia sp. NJR-2017a WRK4]|nr:hypothetical protein CJF32_00000892 [Rutstroemia sp. NJR-2017a WRK4]
MGFTVERGMEMEVVEGERETETEVLGSGELQQRDKYDELGNADEKLGTEDDGVDSKTAGGSRDEDGDKLVVTGGEKLDAGDKIVAIGGANVETLADVNLQDAGFEMEDEKRERMEIGNTETAVEGDVDIDGALIANSVPAVDDSTDPSHLDTTMEDLDSDNNLTNSISNDVQSSSVSDEVVMIQAPVDEPNDKDMENHSEPEKHIQESVRFLNSIELENLEGLPAPMPSLDSSPTKPLITSQDSSLIDQEPRAEQIDDEPVLPPLPKEQVVVEIQKVEIPDSDAFTESSVQSPGKADGKMDSSPVLPKYKDAELDGRAIDRDAGAGQSGRVMSSFGRRCETSDEVDVPMGAGGALKTREGLGDEKTSLSFPEDEDLEMATKRSLGDVEAVERFHNSVVFFYEDEALSSPEASGVDEEVFTSPAQEKAKKRGRPPRRKSSGVVINKEEDHEPAAKKTKTDEVVPDPQMKEVDTQEEMTVMEKKKRGRPAGRKVSQLSVDNSEDDDVPDDDLDATPVKEILAVENVSTIGETPNTTSTGGELVKEVTNSGQRKVLRLAVDDSEDDGEEIQSPVKTTPTKVTEPISLSGGFDDQKSGTETIGTSLVDQTIVNQSPVSEKKRRGRPAGRKASTLSARSETGKDDLVVVDSMVIDTTSVEAGDKARQSTTDREGDDEPTTNEHSTPSAEKKKRGRPTKRKASTLSTNEEESTEVESMLASTADESATINTTDEVDQALKSPNTSLPTLSKRGRPPGRKVSKLSQNREDGVDATLLPDPGITGDISLDNYTSPPEKKKRGRPAGRKVSEIAAKTDAPSEDAHQDTAELTAKVKEEDKFLNAVSPDKKQRGRPPAKKDQIPGNEQAHTGLEQNSAVGVSEEKAGDEDGNVLVNTEGSLEGEPPLEVKKKRGRPSGSVTKGKATGSEESEDTTSPAENKASSSPNIQATEKEGSRSSSKVSGTASISRSESPSASQNKEILFAELKAIKITSLQNRISTLETELLAQRQRLADAKQELRAPADETVKRHIRLLHQYNDIKDVGQGLLGMVAENRGVRIGELYAEGEFGVGRGD